MQENVEWFLILLKMQLRRIDTWILFGIFILFFGLIKEVTIPQNENNTVVLCDLDQSGESVTFSEKLLLEQSVFEFVLLEDEETCRKWIRSGKAVCGFLIKEGFSEKIKEGEQDAIIIYLCTSGNAKGKIAKETVYAKLFSVYSDTLIKKNQEKITDQDSFLFDVRQKKEDYLNGNRLFEVEISKASDQTFQTMPEFQEKTYPVYGMIAVFILTAILMIPGENMEKGRRFFFASQRPGEKIRFLFLQYGVAGLTAAFPAFIYIGLAESLKQTVIQVALLTGFVIICTAEVMILQKIWQKRQSYYAWIMTLVLSNLIAAPVFFDFSVYLPVLRIVRNLFPVGIYLNILNTIG